MPERTTKGKARPGDLGFAACLRDFLPPSLFRQAYARLRWPKHQHWSLQPLLFVLVAVTWCAGDSQAERFEAARAVYVGLHPKRKRPGKTLAGYHQALARLPASLLRFVASLARRQLLARLGPLLHPGGRAVFGCDGTALACP